MKTCFFALAMAVSCHATYAHYEISDVRATPLSPWGMHVSWNFNGPQRDVDGLQTHLVLTNSTDCIVAMPNELSGNTTMKIGENSVFWVAGDRGHLLQAKGVSAVVGTSLFCVIDLAAGPSAAHYPVSYLCLQPQDWSEEYKTTKIVLKCVPAGSFNMVDGGTNSDWEVTFTRPFYMGVFEVTEMQWSLVMGDGYGSSTCPALGRDCVRESGITIGEESFIGKLRKRTGLDLDLPTRAHWKYVCYSGSSNAYSYVDWPNGDYMWCAENSDGAAHPVGLKTPNRWGFYDMYGNADELVLDMDDCWVDPEPRLDNYSWFHGGSYLMKKDSCYRQAYGWGWSVPKDTGFRIVGALP